VAGNGPGQAGEAQRDARPSRVRGSEDRGCRSGRHHLPRAPFAPIETSGPVREEWRDKIVVDATNVYHVPPALAHGVDGGGLATGPQIRREGDSFHGPPDGANPSEPAIGYCQRSRQPAATKFSVDTGEY
jgi:hypothetical protein